MGDWNIRRRQFLEQIGVAAAALPFGKPRAARLPGSIRAVALDGFAVFDPTAVLGVAEELVPGRGVELTSRWRSKQLEYQWQRTLSGRYADFTATAGDGLVFALASLGLSLTAALRARLLETYLTLEPWAGAGEGVRALRAAGLRLAFLSNMTEPMLRDGARRAGFSAAVEHWLSTDRVRSAKPDRRAYAMALEAFGLPRDEIAFVAFAGWDAAGAAGFGFPTVWTNRLGAPAEQLGAPPALTTRDLVGVLGFVRRRG